MTRVRVPSTAVLQDILRYTSEPAVAAELRVSVRTLRRYAAGDMKMNWVTRTRLDGILAEIEARRARERKRSARKREFASGSYASVA